MKYIKSYFESFLTNILIVYHGSNNLHDFTDSGGYLTTGTFFSEDKNVASHYGTYLYEVKIKDNLKIFDTSDINDAQDLCKNFNLIDTYFGEGDEEYHVSANDLINHSNSWEVIENTPRVVDWLIRSGYDGVVIFEDGEKNYLFFHPSEVIVEFKLI